MNERIKLLATKAEFSEKDLHIQGDNFQRFAELIVRECLDIVHNELINQEAIDMEEDIEDRCYLRGNNGAVVDAMIAIKNHFGVE